MRDIQAHDLNTEQRVLAPAGCGLSVLDMDKDEAFFERPTRARDIDAQVDALQRLARVFVELPDAILQELCDVAVAVCGADSAGISVEREDRTEGQYYQWIATAGEYSGFLHAILPEFPSACGTCLQRGAAQHFKADQRFFDILGVTAPLVTDGILLPWAVDGQRGTIFVMAHGRTEAFDKNDVRLMQTFADFATMAIRNRLQQTALMQQAEMAASARTSDRLAHEINNPLQSLTNLVYLASEEDSPTEARNLARELQGPLHRLSGLVKRLLALRHDESLPDGPAV